MSRSGHRTLRGRRRSGPPAARAKDGVKTLEEIQQERDKKNKGFGAFLFQKFRRRHQNR